VAIKPAAGSTGGLTMQPHERRVVDEKDELDERLERLIAFITGAPGFKALDNIDQALLRDQRDAMGEYSDILNKRIERFTGG
jgi:hypothetical protein